MSSSFNNTVLHVLKLFTAWSKNNYEIRKFNYFKYYTKSSKFLSLINFETLQYMFLGNEFH
jgi:hypothetical protein